MGLGTTVILADMENKMKPLIYALAAGTIAVTSYAQGPTVANVVDEVAEIVTEYETHTVEVQVPVRKVQIRQVPRQFNINASVSEVVQSVPCVECVPAVQSVPCVECVPTQAVQQVPCVDCVEPTTVRVSVPVDLQVGPEPPQPTPRGIIGRLCERIRGRRGR